MRFVSWSRKYGIGPLLAGRLLGLRGHPIWHPSTLSSGPTWRTWCTYNHCLKTLTWRIAFEGLLQQLRVRCCRVFGRTLTADSTYAEQHMMSTLNFLKYGKRNWVAAVNSVKSDILYLLLFFTINVSNLWHRFDSPCIMIWIYEYKQKFN
jgi:hypothetical protein